MSAYDITGFLRTAYQPLRTEYRLKKLGLNTAYQKGGHPHEYRLLYLSSYYLAIIKYHVFHCHYYPSFLGTWITAEILSTVRSY